MRINLKHACGCWKKHEFFGTVAERAPQILKTRAKRCRACIARETALDVARKIMSEPRSDLRPAA